MSSLNGHGPRAVPPIQPELTILELAAAEPVGTALRRVLAAPNAVVLFLPNEARWSEADFEWLARRAAQVGRRVAVVAANGATREAAIAAGLPTFRQVPQALSGSWRGQVSSWPTRTVGRAAEMRARPAPPRPRARRPWRLPLAPRLLLAIPVAAAAVGLALLAVTSLPSGLVLVRPARQPVATTLNVTVATQAGADELGVATGRWLEAATEGRLDVVAGGGSEPGDERATGSVAALNRRSEAVSIPAGAIVETTAGARVRFRLTEKVDLPAQVGATARAPIVALEAGSAGNVPAYAINAIEPSWAASVAVVNDRATEGGATRAQPVITNTDQDRARDELEARLRDEALAGVRAQLALGETLAEQTIRTSILSERFDLEPARRAEGTLSMRLRATALSYDPSRVEAAASRLLESQTPQGWRLVPEKTRLEVADRPRLTAVEGRQVLVPVAAQAERVALVNRDAVRNAVRGLTPAEAEKAAGRVVPLAEPAWVGLEPAWLMRLWQRLPWLPRRLPMLPARIDVVVLENGS